MKHHVFITEQAQREAQANHDWWANNRSPEQASRWYNEFLRAAHSLEKNADRWAVAPESGRFSYELRQLNFGIGRKRTHRILYTIRQNDVVVLRVRHLAQDIVE